MAHVNVPKGLFYYVGETPPALQCGYYTEDRVLITTLSGATLTAKCKLGDSGTEFDVSCTNPGTGLFTIDWPTGTSSFAGEGTLRVDVEVDDGTYKWHLPRFSVEIRARA